MKTLFLSKTITSFVVKAQDVLGRGASSPNHDYTFTDEFFSDTSVIVSTESEYETKYYLS